MEFYICFGHENKTGIVFWSFFKIDLSSAMTIESSRGNLDSNMAEHKAILKTGPNTYYSRFRSQNKYCFP